jgi:hypothetical protein
VIPLVAVVAVLLELAWLLMLALVVMRAPYISVLHGLVQAVTSVGGLFR